MEQKKRTEIAELGEFGLIERLAGKVGDDAAVIGEGAAGSAGVGTKNGGTAANGGGGTELLLLSSDMLLEGVDFDLTYFPMQHLGYKVITRGASDILAMNGLPTGVTLSLGVSAKLSVEDLEEFYAGARKACEELGAEIVGGDTTASVTGFAINISVVGTVPCDRITYRSGARENDLICITRDLGAAYLGLHLLEREKRALAGTGTTKAGGEEAEATEPGALRPKFEGYEYLLERQLKPRARKDVIDALAAENIVPTSMIDISDGLASDLLQICRASRCGARIYLDRLPIAREAHALAEELNIDPVVAALNGGDDHELLFTVPLAMRERIVKLGAGIEIIGHITANDGGEGVWSSAGVVLVTPDGTNVPIKAQGFKNE